MERDDAWMERTARAGIVDMAMRGWSGGAEIPMDFMGGYMTVGLSSVLAVMVAAERVGLVPCLPDGWLVGIYDRIARVAAAPSPYMAVLAHDGLAGRAAAGPRPSEPVFLLSLQGRDAPTSLKVMLGSLLPFRRRNVVPDLPRQWWSRPDPIRTPLRYRRPARAHARGMDDGTTCDVRKGQ